MLRALQWRGLSRILARRLVCRWQAGVSEVGGVPRVGACQRRMSFLGRGGEHDVVRTDIRTAVDDDRETQIQNAIDSLLARQQMYEIALIEVLQALPRHRAIEVANGLRARVNEWARQSGAMLTPAVDEAVSAQLATFLGVLEDPQLSLRL